MERTAYLSLLLMLALVACPGCSFTRICPVAGGPARDRTLPSDVRLVAAGDHGAFETIGRVHVHSIAPNWLPFLLLSPEQLESRLRKGAATVGAEALTDVRRYSRSQLEWREEHLMGTAVVRSRGGDSDAP